MILVTLMMTLELVQRSVNSPAVKTREIVQQVQPAAADTLRRIAELKRQLEQQAAVATAAAVLDIKSVSERLQDARRTAASLDVEVARLEIDARDAERRRQQAQQVQSQTAMQEQERQKLEDEARRLKVELDKLKSSNRIVFNRDPGNAKTPWLLELTGSTIIVAQVGVSAPPTEFKGSTLAENITSFLTWTNDRDPDAEYFVLLVRPSAVEAFHQLQQQLLGQGFDFGFDVLSEHQTVIDPKTGASTP